MQSTVAGEVYLLRREQKVTRSLVTTTRYKASVDAINIVSTLIMSKKC